MREAFLFKRSTITLFILGFLLLAILLTLKLVEQRQEVRRRAEAATTLSFTPAQTAVDVGDEIVLTVEIDTGTNQVTAADLTVLYDTAYLEGLDIKKDNYLPVVLTAGTIGGGQAHIVVGATPSQPQMGQGTLATLKFRALVPVTETQVVFDTTTQVAAIGEIGNVLTSSSPARIRIGQILPSPTPTLTPTPTPGASPTNASPTPSPLSDPCLNQQPAIPTGLTAATLSTSQIHLSWTSVQNITHYGIVYGTASNKYSYGAANVGNVNGFTVGSLASGTRYYFAVFSVNDCGTRGYSTEVSQATQSSGVGGTSIASPKPSPTSTTTTTKPKTSPSPSPQFVPLDPNASEKEQIPFLAQKGNISPKNLPVVPKVSIPPKSEPKNAGLSALLTPLGGILLIMAAIFATFFFFKMRS